MSETTTTCIGDEMSSKSGKQSRARRVEAVKAAQYFVMFGDEIPSDFDERQIRIYNKYVKQLSERGKL